MREHSDKSDPDEQEALDRLLPSEQQTGDRIADLSEAGRIIMRRRVDNSRWGGVIIAALYRELHSWRKVSKATGIPLRTARRWATPPPGTKGT